MYSRCYIAYLPITPYASAFSVSLSLHLSPHSHDITSYYSFHMNELLTYTMSLLTVLHTFSSGAPQYGRERPRKARHTITCRAFYNYNYLITTAYDTAAAPISICSIRTNARCPSRDWCYSKNWHGRGSPTEDSNAQGTWCDRCDSRKWCVEWRPYWKWRVDGRLEADGVGQVEMGRSHCTSSDRVQDHQWQ